MGIRVQAGTLRIPTGTTPANYWYEAGIDTASPGEAVTISTANPSNPRRTFIVAYIDESVTRTSSVTNNTNNVLKLAAVDGTAASSPSDPTTSQITTAIGASNPYIILARIAVGTGVTQITNSDITDLRTMIAIGGDHLAPSAIKLGYAEIVAPVTGITSEADIVSVGVTVPAGGRDIEIVFNVADITTSANGQRALINFKEGATSLRKFYKWLPSTSGGNGGTWIARVSAPSAGSHTYKVALTRDAGAGSIDAYAAGSPEQASILVKAI